MRNLLPVVALGTLLGTASPVASQSADPVIDMHMHARTTAARTADGALAHPPCLPVGCARHRTVVRSTPT